MPSPELAECQASEHTIRSIAGHVSQKMLEHYSHIRLDAKRTALDALSQRGGRAGYGTNNATNEPETDTVNPQVIEGIGGREGIRTPGLLVANEALSQLSYSPTSSEQILAEAKILANRVRSCVTRTEHQTKRGADAAPRRNDLNENTTNLWLIRRGAHPLRYHLARVLIQRSRLRNGVHGLLHLWIGLELYLEAFLLAKR